MKILFGVIHYPLKKLQSMFEEWEIVAEIIGFNSSGSLGYGICSEYAKRLPVAYIISGEEIYIVSDEALSDMAWEISDGSKVIFETPKKHSEKKRLAYNIRLNQIK